ncbi:MAG: NAD(P)-dependent oxidoreductase [Rhodobacteraceae bacterium]|nr:MAG: NAD(P)-dependent oxidoreductase [Paracoccaceae bacterium]
MDKRLLIFGFGYCADSLLLNLRNKRWKINVVTRNIEKINGLRKRGVVAFQWFEKKKIQNSIQKASNILITVPPVGFSDPVKENFSELFSELPANSKLVYLSSTGVYGDHRGNWVDEKSTLDPKTSLGVSRLNAEKIWQKVSNELGLTLIILRLAGIYGSGRSPIDKLKKGKVTVVRKPGVLFSRIHIDDIVEIISLSLEKNGISGVYNVCDNKPESSENVMQEACRLLGYKCPEAIPIEKLNLSKTALDFYSESKKVSNKKLLEDFSYQMIHPDYFSGLEEILAKVRNNSK